MLRPPFAAAALACAALFVLPLRPAPAGEPAAPAAPAAGPAKRVVVVTGIDYPGHKWKETAPLLTQGLEKDARLKIRVVEDIEFLASPELKEFDVAVLHFMPWKVKPPTQAARDNLKAFVEGGKGMVVIHFANGAFPDWPEYRNLAGRAYDPKMRGHDSHGTVHVEIAKPDHPITKGLAAFDTVDELYTCNAGDAPIEILATATSKVDKKDYPVAFVLNYGKGRVFHCPLGHSVKAFGEPALDLIRRGTAWAAGLPPVP
jgi:type 1 glutamine amidotransferase